MTGRSSAWLERSVRDAEVAGSNPVAPSQIGLFAPGRFAVPSLDVRLVSVAVGVDMAVRLDANPGLSEVVMSRFRCVSGAPTGRFRVFAAARSPRPSRFPERRLNIGL